MRGENLVIYITGMLVKLVIVTQKDCVKDGSCLGLSERTQVKDVAGLLGFLGGDGGCTPKQFLTERSDFVLGKTQATRPCGG